MGDTATLAAPPAAVPSTGLRAGIELFLISLLILFLELACIRWFPANVVFLTFFTNTVLIGCFLGMSVGCMAASHRRDYLAWTPPLLLVALIAAHVLLYVKTKWEVAVDVANQSSPQVIFFGAEHSNRDLAGFIIPVEVVSGFFFLIIALLMVGPGQELGRAFVRIPNRVAAYTVNILGSLGGIVLFALFSLWELTPFWWFLAAVLVLAVFLVPRCLSRGKVWLAALALLFVGIIWLADLHSGVHSRQKTSPATYAKESLHRYFPFLGSPVQEGEQFSEGLWSPYYQIRYLSAPDREINVNQIGHQHMVSTGESFPAYALPHLLNRDTGGKTFDDVLIIGAGSGNDVSRALQWGAKHIDAVEIDPAIQRLGARDHPDRPYQDPRVSLHLGDGRNFLKSTEKQYDLVVYALVDSLVLHSSYSNIRLESYLFTRQAFEDVKRRLKPGGLFIMYNYFRQGWLMARLHQSLNEVFGAEPLVFVLPHQEMVTPDDGLSDSFTLFMTGNTEHLKKGLDGNKLYWLRTDVPPGPQSPNGFEQKPAPNDERSKWQRYGLARVVQPEGGVGVATDDWPFLYLRHPIVPTLSLRGAAVMGILALVLIFVFLPKPQGTGGRWSFDGRMFLLGAGFMLIETKAVVQMALLFGSTWMVNSVVFFAVLVMILAANLFVLLVRPQRLALYYVGLLASLALNCVVPLDFFLGMDRTIQTVGSCVLVFTPILFAGIIFAVLFSRTREPDRAYGANIAGAMLGGLAEYTSMLLGFQYLVLVALAFYALSMLGLRWPTSARTEPQIAR